MSASVNPTPASPQAIGTPIALTATPAGGTAPQQCKWWVTANNWQTYTLLRDWQACTTALPWTPTTAGNYQVGVWARSAGATADAPQGSAGVAYEVVPSVLGTYSGSGVATQSSCTFAIDNGTFPFTGSFVIPTQTRATFTGTGTFDAGEDVVTTTLAGTVTGSGQISGTLTIAPGMGGTVGLSGTLVGTTLSVTFAGPVQEPGAACYLNGWFAGTR